MSGEVIHNHAAFIWSVADLLRGVYKQSEYGRVILPLTVLRRLDCVLEPTKADVLERLEELPVTLRNREPLLEQAAGQSFFNTSRHTFATLLGDPDNVAGNLRNYIARFSESARDIVDKFNFDVQIDRLDDHNLLYLVVSKFADIDLSPETVSNLEMGYLYEELIRKFSELSNETAGEHFTPREVIRLMVNLLFVDDNELLTRPGIVKTLLDPACGTGGMLSVAEDHLRRLNPQARLKVFGQEVNAETYATCRADMLIKGQEASNIRFGNSFDDDQHQGERFDYLLANPPFGVEWKMVAATIRDEHAIQGFAGRFGAGLPRINDGSFLFLQHMISKMKRPEEGGARLAIVFNGSPQFTGGAGSGESEIRRWIIENDMLEAVVALPDQLFYNTGISTYFWVVTNRKAPKRRGKVQLINARESFTKMRKSLGQKRKEVSAAQIDEITRLYGAFEEGPRVKIFPNESFGFLRITVERPLRLRWEITDHTLAAVEADKKVAKLGAQQREALLEKLRTRHGATFATEKPARQVVQEALLSAGTNKPPALVKALTDGLAVRDPEAPVVTDRASDPKPDPHLRDYENVPLPNMRVTFEADPTARLETVEYRTVIDDYMAQEVLPYVSDAWHAPTKTKIGYEIPLTREFYAYTPPRPLADIDAELVVLIELLRQRRVAPVSEELQCREERTRAMRLRHVADIRVSNVDKKTSEGEIPVRLINYTEVYYGDRLVPELELMHATASRSQLDSFRLCPGDVVITKDSETPEDIGVAAYVERSSDDLVCGYHLAIIRPIQGRIDGRFLYWAMCSSNVARQLSSRATGITRFGLRLDAIADVEIEVPSLERQREIADYLDAEAARIDVSIDEMHKQIGLSSEYRHALITAVSSGDLPSAEFLG